MRLYAFGVVQRNPASAGLELAPAGAGALTGLHSSDGEDSGSGKPTGGCIVGAGAAADVQVRHGDPHLESVVAVHDSSTIPRSVDRLPVRIEHGVARILVGAGFGICEDSIRAFLGLGIRPRLADTVELLLLRGRTTESCCDLRGKVAHPGIHPVTGAAFVGKPPMDGQNHLIALRTVVQRFRFVSKPEQLGFAVALTDINAELDERPVDDVLERIRLGAVAGALDGDGSLVVGCGRGAPRAVFLFHIHTDSAVRPDAVVAACLT